ncbi:MAG TPA: hypothetical protein VIJ93_13025, partial [bacterium]
MKYPPREKNLPFLTKGPPKVLSLFQFKYLRLCGMACGLFLFGSSAFAQEQFNGVFLSDNNPQVGETIAVTVNWCDFTRFNSPFFLAALSTATTLQNCPANYQNYFVDANGVTNINDTGLSGAINGFQYPTASAAGVTDCSGGANRQVVWYLTIPSSLYGPFPGNQVLPGGVFYIDIGAKRDSLSCASDAGITQISLPITIFVGTPRFSITKTAEDNAAAPNDLILFKMDYSFVNTNNFTIRDTVPANTTLVSVGPPGVASEAVSGATAGSGVTWTLGSTVAEKDGQVWMLVRVNAGTPSGTNISNTAIGNSTEVGTQNSNTATSTVGGGGQILKSESTTSATAGQVVTYTLDWNVDGVSLQFYDSYDNNAVGTANSSIVGFDGTGYTASAAGFTIVQGPDGNNYIKAPISSGFPTLLRNGPSVSICGNYMVEGDMRIPGSASVGSDAHMVIALNTVTCDSYMVAISKDTNPANFFLQKKIGCGGGGPTYLPPAPINNGNVALQGVSIVEDQWYTVKTLVIQSGANLIISSKIWIRGTAEPPNWTFTYTDITPLS